MDELVNENTEEAWTAKLTARTSRPFNVMSSILSKGCFFKIFLTVYTGRRQRVTLQYVKTCVSDCEEHKMLMRESRVLGAFSCLLRRKALELLVTRPSIVLKALRYARLYYKLSVANRALGFQSRFLQVFFSILNQESTQRQHMM